MLCGISSSWESSIYRFIMANYWFWYRYEWKLFSWGINENKLFIFSKSNKVFVFFVKGPFFFRLFIISLLWKCQRQGNQIFYGWNFEVCFENFWKNRSLTTGCSLVSFELELLEIAYVCRRKVLLCHRGWRRCIWSVADKAIIVLEFAFIK